jgi:hypothetical protein
MSWRLAHVAAWIGTLKDLNIRWWYWLMVLGFEADSPAALATVVGVPPEGPVRLAVSA